MAILMSVEINALKKIINSFKTLPIEKKQDPAIFLELCKNNNYHRSILIELFTIAPNSIKENREVVSYLVKNRVSILEQTPFIIDEELLFISINSSDNLVNVKFACLKEPLFKKIKHYLLKHFYWQIVKLFLC
jgi:hypothetical protein